MNIDCRTVWWPLQICSFNKEMDLGEWEGRGRSLSPHSDSIQCTNNNCVRKGVAVGGRAGALVGWTWYRPIIYVD